MRGQVLPGSLAAARVARRLSRRLPCQALCKVVNWLNQNTLDYGSDKKIDDVLYSPHDVFLAKGSVFVDIRCVVLEEKRRVSAGRSLTQALGMRGRGQGASRIPHHPALKNFISSEL